MISIVKDGLFTFLCGSLTGKRYWLLLENSGNLNFAQYKIKITDAREQKALKYLCMCAHVLMNVHSLVVNPLPHCGEAVVFAAVCTCQGDCVYLCRDTPTGGCQQHTNKLSGENQSGLWNDTGRGKYTAAAHKPKAQRHEAPMMRLRGSSGASPVAPGQRCRPHRPDLNSELLATGRFDGRHQDGRVGVTACCFWCSGGVVCLLCRCRAPVLPARTHGEGHSRAQPDHLVMWLEPRQQILCDIQSGQEGKSFRCVSVLTKCAWKQGSGWILVLISN